MHPVIAAGPLQFQTHDFSRPQTAAWFCGAPVHLDLQEHAATTSRHNDRQHHLAFSQLDHTLGPQAQSSLLHGLPLPLRLPSVQRSSTSKATPPKVTHAAP